MKPTRRIPIAEKFFLCEGDILFSAMHTLTITVNTVGVMGKGLAAQTKRQFPDVFAVYQDVCRKELLTMGIPYLYKREGPKWFLLFPTKLHWKNNSKIDGIEEGLRWLSANYKVLGIQSMALPALGCGLGGLAWSDVGPIMYKYLIKLEIPIEVYPPRETTADVDLLKQAMS